MGRGEDDVGLPRPLLEWAAPGAGAAHFVGGVGRMFGAAAITQLQGEMTYVTQ